MHAALTVLCAFTALAAGLALAMLLVPIHLRARGVFTDEMLDMVVVASWPLGVATARVSPDEGVVVRLVGVPVYRYRELGKKQARPAPERPASRRMPSPRRIARIVRRSVASLRLRATVAGRVGAGDPADTAAVHGSLILARQLLPGLDTRHVVVDWLHPALDLDAEVEGRVWPLAIAGIAIDEFAFQPR